MGFLPIIMFREKDLEELQLPSYDNGYYQITDDLSVDVEGIIRLDIGHVTAYVATVHNLEELKEFIKIAKR